LIHPALRNEPWPWIRPQPAYTRRYQLMIILNVAVLVIFAAFQNKYVQLNWPDWHGLLLLSPFLLPLLMGILIVDVMIPRMTRTDPLIPIDYRRSSALAIVTFLLVYAALPAFGFFKLAFDTEMKLQAVFAHFDYDQDRRKRQERVKEESRGLQFADPAVRARFYEDRLLSYTRDIYDNLLFADKRAGPKTFFERVHALLRAPLDNPVSRETGAAFEWKGQNTSSDVTLNKSCTVTDGTPPCLPTVPVWLYVALTFGGLIILGGSALFDAIEERGRMKNGMLQHGAALLVVLIVVGIFYRWTEPDMLVGILALAFFAWLLYVMPQFILHRVLMSDEGRQELPGRTPEEGLPAMPPAKPSVWTQAWRPIAVGLVGIGFFLLYTQEELRPITTAVLTAAVPALIPQLLGRSG
jgi:hypothetical protein